MATKCEFIKDDGSRCGAWALSDDALCRAHRMQVDGVEDPNLTAGRLPEIRNLPGVNGRLPRDATLADRLENQLYKVIAFLESKEDIDIDIAKLTVKAFDLLEQLGEVRLKTEGSELVIRDATGWPPGARED